MKGSKMEEDAFDFGEINAPRWVDFGSMDTYNEEDSWFQQSESQSKNKAVTDIAAPTMSPIAAHTAVATTTATAKTEKIVEKNLQKNSLELTQPEEFQFATETRARSAGEEVVKQKTKKKKEWNGELTVPQEFAFQTDSRARVVEEESTPVEKKTSKKKYDPTKLTEPVEFNFESEVRLAGKRIAKGEVLITTEEKQEIKAKAMPKFKALELDPNVLEPTGAAGLYRMEKKELTNPQAFMFHTDARAEMNIAEEDDEDDPLAQWANAKKVKEIKKRGALTLTEPITPKLSTRVRGEVKAQQLEEREKQRNHIEQFKAQPIYVPPPTRSSAPVQARPLTEPATPNLRTRTRGKIHEEVLKDRLQREEEEAIEARNFKAGPITRSMARNTKVAKRRPLTTPQPFGLCTDRRGEMKKALEMKENVNSCPTGKKRKRSQVDANGHRALTEPQPFQFSTSDRAATRRAFDEVVEEKNFSRSEMESRYADERARQEKREIKRMRKNMVHHACPVQYEDMRPLGGKVVHMQLTEPKTPKFHTDTRVAMRKQLSHMQPGGLF